MVAATHTHKDLTRFQEVQTIDDTPKSLRKLFWTFEEIYLQVPVNLKFFI